MKLTELAALVGAMTDAPWTVDEHCLPCRNRSGGEQPGFGVPEAMTLGDMECAAMPLGNAAGIVALRNRAAKLLAVCEAAEAAVDVWGSHAEDSDEWGSLNKLRAALRDLEAK